MSNGNETMEMTLKTVEIWQWTPKLRIKMITQTENPPWKMKMGKSENEKERKLRHTRGWVEKWGWKRTENKKMKWKDDKKSERNEWHEWMRTSEMKWKMCEMK